MNPHAPFVSALVRLSCAAAAGAGCQVLAEDPYVVIWARQPGTSQIDAAMAVALGPGDAVALAGRTNGSLYGPGAGFTDAFVVTYDATGTLLWSRQMGTSGNDGGTGVGFAPGGDVYAGGFTRGSLGGPNAGGDDIFLFRLDTAGAVVWMRQFGTADHDSMEKLVVDAAGDVLIGGWTTGSLGAPNAGGFDLLAIKVDPAGTVTWSRQFGTPGDDVCLGIATAPGGGAYVGGMTTGALSGTNAGDNDLFVMRLDAAGAPVWTRQAGTAGDDRCTSVASDSAGNVYVAGFTSGGLYAANAGAYDAFLVKYDAAGTVAWSRQMGTAESDFAYGIASDAAGSTYLTGQTTGALAGPVIGLDDAFVFKHDASGSQTWSRHVGTVTPDLGFAVAAGVQSVVVAGQTSGDLGGQSQGNRDAFVAKLGPGCYPDCNGDQALNLADFGCFQTKFALQDPYADCNGDNQINLADFGCFQTRFALGCP